MARYGDIVFGTLGGSADRAGLFAAFAGAGIDVTFGAARHALEAWGDGVSRVMDGALWFWGVRDDGVRIRPIVPRDATAFRSILQNLTANDLYMRFHGSVKPDGFDIGPYVDGRSGVIGLIAERGGKALGAAHAFLGPNSADVAAMVAGDARSHGIGRALFRQLFDILSKRGCEHVTAEVLSGNIPCLRLLKKMGMEVVGASNGEVVLEGCPAKLLVAPVRPEKSGVDRRSVRSALQFAG